MTEASMSAWALSPPLVLAAAALAGLALGFVFFAGLFWTTRRAATSPRPALWLFSSLMVRMAIALIGFHAVGAGRWDRLLACLIGFVVARFIVMRMTRPAHSTAAADAPREARHAP